MEIWRLLSDGNKRGSKREREGRGGRSESSQGGVR